MTTPDTRRSGIVLPLVLIIALLLSTSIVTFVRRSVVDGMIVRNRDKAAAAAALARGGIRIATAVLFQDRTSKQLRTLSEGATPGATLDDLWARVGDASLSTFWGATLRITIEDAGGRLNLNSLVPVGAEGLEAQASDESEEFLVEFIRKILDEMEFQTEERLYDPREMARNLLDYIDADDVAIGGRREDDYYLRQTPPYTAANRPLLSVDEIAMIEGFDAQIMEAMRPYVTVYPLAGQTGIDINTAPAHVLALVYHGSSGDMRLSDEDTVRQILEVRQQDSIVCTESAADPERCVGLSEVGLGEGGIYPQVSLPATVTLFLVRAEATVDDVVRSVETVIDVDNADEPRLLSWKAR